MYIAFLFPDRKKRKKNGCIKILTVHSQLRSTRSTLQIISVRNHLFFPRPLPKPRKGPPQSFHPLIYSYFYLVLFTRPIILLTSEPPPAFTLTGCYRALSAGRYQGPYRNHIRCHQQNTPGRHLSPRTDSSTRARGQRLRGRTGAGALGLPCAGNQIFVIITIIVFITSLTVVVISFINNTI